jgi:putative ATPase
MSDLFGNEAKQVESADMPLAARMRPRNLSEFSGQAHILGEGKLLRRAILADRVQSIILYGPPGTGKTTLAEIIAGETKSHFERLSGVEASVADLRRVIETAKNRRVNSGKKTILFLDEIHRLNKAQQDVLLPDVERGVVSLIGATTHNPFFFVINALVSRSQIFELQPLSEGEIAEILKRAVADQERGLGKSKVRVTEEAIQHWAKVSDGDARRALNALEVAARTTLGGQIDLAAAEESIQKRVVRYDADEDEHYDTISAFIKSMRGSDPDAALYWLAKMLLAGEDIRFIARRIVICAAEDVGLADPRALLVANACFQSVELVGMPEARIILAEATVYVATSPKSNASYYGIENAIASIKKGAVKLVPKHLQSTAYKSAKKLGRGKGYEYAHSHPKHYVEQDYGVSETFYNPGELGYEKKIAEFLTWLKQN